MTFRRVRQGGFELRDVSEPFLGMLQELPEIPERYSAEAEARLYPPPVEKSDSLEELEEDWKAHVEPELRRLFAEARSLVRGDLAQLDSNSAGRRTLRVPAQNVEAWMHTLTQARLAMAEAHSFTETELSQPHHGPWTTPRHFARLQMDFYAGLLEWILSGTKP